MNRKAALLILLVGVALLVAALTDVFGMSHGVNLDIGIKKLSEWPTERISLAAVGGALAALGLLIVARKGGKK